MRMKKFIVVFGMGLFLLLGVVCGAALSAESLPSEDGRLNITPRAYDSDGILQLGVKFIFSEEKTIFSWRDSVYLLLGHGVFFEVAPLNGSESLQVISVEKVRPKHVDPRYMITAKVYEYPKPLSLEILIQSGEPYLGCLEVAMTYDSRGLINYPKSLSKVKVSSNTVRVCNISTEN